jgi:hypothetical protein
MRIAYCLLLKGMEHRMLREAKEVSYTRTIGSAKTHEWDCSAGESGKLLGPLMLTTLAIIGIPDILEVGAGTQIVNVPVRP